MNAKANKYKPEFDVILDTRHPLPARDIRWIEGAVAHRQIRRRIDAVDQRGAASTSDGVGHHGQDVALVVVVGHDKGNFILGAGFHFGVVEILESFSVDAAGAIGA